MPKAGAANSKRSCRGSLDGATPDNKNGLHRQRGNVDLVQTRSATSNEILSTIILEDMWESGLWRRVVCDYHDRFTHGLIVRFRSSDEAQQPSPVTISQSAAGKDWNVSDPMSTGSSVWDSALILSEFFYQRPSLVVDQRILELGAGTGLVGLAAHRLGATYVALTDLPHMTPLLRKNTARNCPGLVSGVSVHTLDWKDVQKAELVSGGHNFDLVVMADVLYHECTIEALFAALVGIASLKTSRAQLRGYWAQEMHQPDLIERFISSLSTAGWQVNPISEISDGVGLDIVVFELAAPNFQQ